jgi:dihydroorotate dehydrogenase
VPILYPLARAALFRLPAETAHEIVIDSLGRLPGPARGMLRRAYRVRDPRLQTRLWGVDFENPVGLAAGFDKNARSFNALGSLGFGFVEVGTVTAHAQPGNPRPRVFRLPADDALLNRMGFNNPGAEEVARHLSTTRMETVLGINIGKSRTTPLEDAVEDYLRSVELLAPFARYLVINVSSPNTPGLRELQDAAPLRHLLRAVVGRLSAQSQPAPPILLKVAPDLSDEQLDQAVEIAMEEGISGMVAVNTTISREDLQTPAAAVVALGEGGISGRPIRVRAQAVVARIRRRSEGRLPIIGVGGIFTAADAWDRICAGANLIQLYTGFVYGGPAVVKRINEGLLDRLSAEGFGSVTEAVGSRDR